MVGMNRYRILLALILFVLPVTLSAGDGEAEWRRRIKTSEQAIATGQDLARHYYNLGVYYGKLSDWRLAVENYKRAWKRGPETPDIFYALGYALVKSGQVKEGEETFRRALALDPAHYRALLGLGLISMKREQWDQARDCFQRSLQAKPDYWPAIYNLAIIAREQRDFQQQTRLFEQVLRIAPGRDEIRVELGLAYYKLEAWVPAINNLRAYLKGHPANRRVKRYLALCLLEAGVVPLAAKLYEELLQTKTGDAGLHHNLALCYRRLGRFAAARLEFNAVLRLEPANADAMCGLGDLAVEDGDLITAEAFYRKAASARPKHRPALLAIAWVYEQGDRLTDAAVYYRQALKLADDPDSRFNLGLIYGKLNKYRAAAEEFAAVLSFSPNDVAAAYQRADCLQRAGAKQAAVSAWREYLRLSQGMKDERRSRREAEAKLKALESAETKNGR